MVSRQRTQSFLCLHSPLRVLRASAVKYFPAFLVLASLLCLQLALPAPALSTALERYVHRPEPQFSWKLKDKVDIAESGDRIYELHFMSQVWQGIRWEHQLQVYRPRDVRPNPTLLLWVTGGAPRPASISLGFELARQIHAPVAFLYHIPNQPLLEAKLFEDDLIAETFVRYLKTKDEDWPLLFPMVKSVIKAMDVLQAFGKQQWDAPIHSFIVSGASKRGWTSWLAAAVDKRIRAIAPLVIDTLNMREQMPRQLEAFGAYSAELAPYTARGLLPIPETPEAERLLNMVDPWAYRNRLVLPKLIVNGTNDFYWAIDALNVYWRDIPGDNRVIYVPNAGHDLRRRDRPQGDQLTHLLNGLAAFVRYQGSGRAMPSLNWLHESIGGKLQLTVDATPPPGAARLWVARSPTQDFRAAKWIARPVTISGGKIIGEVTRPEKGYVAFFGELDYSIDGLRHQLSTQVRIFECQAAVC